MSSISLLDYWKCLNYIFNVHDMKQDGLTGEDVLNLIESQKYYVFNDTTCVVTTDEMVAFLLTAKDGKIISAEEVPLCLIERNV